MISLLPVLLVLLAATTCSGQDGVEKNTWVVLASESESMEDVPHICNAIDVESTLVFVTGYYERNGGVLRAPFLASLSGSSISSYKQLNSIVSPTGDVEVGEEGEGIDLAVDTGAKGSVYTLISANDNDSEQMFLYKSGLSGEPTVIKKEPDAQGAAVTLRGDGSGVLVAGNATSDSFALNRGWFVALYGADELQYVHGVSLQDNDIQDEIQDVIDIVYDVAIDQAYALCRSASNEEGVRVLVAAVSVSVPDGGDVDQEEELTLEWMLPLPKTLPGDAFPVAISASLDQTVVAIYHYSDEESALHASYAKVGSAGVLLGELVNEKSNSREVTPLPDNRSQVGVGIDATRRGRVQALIQAVRALPCPASRAAALTGSPFGIPAVGRQGNELAGGSAVELYRSLEQLHERLEWDVVDCLDSTEQATEPLKFVDSDYTAIEEIDALVETWALVLPKPVNGRHGIQWTELTYTLQEAPPMWTNVLNITCTLEFDEAVEKNDECRRVIDGIRQIVQDATNTTKLEYVHVVQNETPEDTDCATDVDDRDLVLECFDCVDGQDDSVATQIRKIMEDLFKTGGRIESSLDINTRLAPCETSSVDYLDTSTPTPTPEPTPKPNEAAKGGLATGAIVGIVLGCGVMAIIVGVVAALVIVRRRGKGAYDIAYGESGRPV